jgi:hypothetical protein
MEEITIKNKAMNENIDLTKILKDCPRGTKFYSAVDGDVVFWGIIESSPYPIFTDKSTYTKKGTEYIDRGECVFFPSKGQRDWSMFVPTWEQKKPKVKVTIHPFDKVLGKFENAINEKWHADVFTQKLEDSDDEDENGLYCLGFKYDKILPYNKDTAHLLGTNDDCPIDYEIEISKEYKE